MKVITAPEKFDDGLLAFDGKITVFLAGGISECWDWQKAVIDAIEKSGFDTDKLVIFNPRREKFDINDKSASAEQIKWEFKALELCNIFSMYFCESISVQPICMYELGRYLGPGGRYKNTIITAESGYKRLYDVIAQTNLATNYHTPVHVFRHPSDAVERHTIAILDAYESRKCTQLEMEHKRIEREVQ